jgi:hypothetical protein
LKGGGEVSNSHTLFIELEKRLDRDVQNFKPEEREGKREEGRGKIYKFFDGSSPGKF